MATKSRKKPSNSDYRADDAVLKMLKKKIAGASKHRRPEMLGDLIARTYMARAVRGEKGAIRALIHLHDMVDDVDQLEPLVVELNGRDAEL